MLGESVQDNVIFAFLCIACVAPLLPLLSGVRSWRPWSSLQSAVGAAGNTISWWKEEVEEDEVSLRVQAKMQQLKVEHIRVGCRCICMIMTPMTLWMMYNIASKTPRDYTFMQDVAHTMLHIVTALCCAYPAVITWKTVDIVVTIFAAGCMLFLAPWFCRPHMFMAVLLAVNSAVVLLNLVRRSLPVILALNVLIGATALFGIFYHGASLGTDAGSAAMVQVCFLACIPICAHLLEVSLKATVRQAIEVQAAKEVILAASALLKSCCDVVVELDCEGTILSPALDLGSFLLRGPGRRLQYTRLADLISHEEDKEMFVTKLSAPPPIGSEMAEAIHVRVRDGNDNVLRVQLLWFRFAHLDGQPRYMLGMREFSDMAVVGNLQSASPLRAATFSEEDADGSLSESSLVSVETTEGERALVVVDTAADGMPVRHASAAFTKRVGRVNSGAPFLQYVAQSERFVRWVQAAVNAMVEGHDRPHCHVVLNMRQGQMRATCRIFEMQQQSPEESSSYDLENVQLLFFNIEAKRGRSRTRRPVGQVGPLRGTPVVRMAL